MRVFFCGTTTACKNMRTQNVSKMYNIRNGYLFIQMLACMLCNANWNKFYASQKSSVEPNTCTLKPQQWSAYTMIRERSLLVAPENLIPESNRGNTERFFTFSVRFLCFFMHLMRFFFQVEMCLCFWCVFIGLYNNFSGLNFNYNALHPE